MGREIYILRRTNIVTYKISFPVSMFYLPELLVLLSSDLIVSDFLVLNVPLPRIDISIEMRSSFDRLIPGSIVKW